MLARRGGKGLAIAALVVLGLLLTACPRPLVPPSGLPGSGGPALDSASTSELVTGQVTFAPRSVQATIKDDVAPGATVSLIGGHQRIAAHRGLGADLPRRSGRRSGRHDLHR